MNHLSALNLSITRRQTLLHKINLTLNTAEMVGIVGPNGAGKSTLLRALCGLETPNTGEVQLANLPLRDLTPNARAQQVAYLPQDPPVHWPVSVADVVALGRLHSKQTDAARIDQAIEQTGLAALQQRRMDQLSAGERMRVHIARLLASDARFLLADEPVTALDPFHQLQCLTVLRRQTEVDKGVAVVLHDLTLAARFCQRIVVLAQGQIVAEGSPREVLSAALIQQVYGVTSINASVDGQQYAIPWQVDETVIGSDDSSAPT